METITRARRTAPSAGLSTAATRLTALPALNRALSTEVDGGRATREPLLDRLDRALGIHDLGGIDGNIVGVPVRERAVAIFARARLVA